MLVIQFAKAAGAVVIATTSSEKKAEKLKKLGADHVINYKTDPNWGETARKLTPDCAGVDHIIEVGGTGTLAQSFKAVKLEGMISIIGFLGGVENQGQPSVLDTLSNVCTVRGVYVGSKALMQDMIRAIEANDIHPVVDDSVFPLDQARKAYDHMVSGYDQYLIRISHTDILCSGLKDISERWWSRSTRRHHFPFRHGETILTQKYRFYLVETISEVAHKLNEMRFKRPSYSVNEKLTFHSAVD